MHKYSVILLALLLGAAPVRFGDEKDEMQVPVGLQLDIFVKVLTFDRSMEERPGDEIVVGIAYHPRVRESYIAKDQLVDAIAETRASIHGRMLRAVPIVADSPEALDEAISLHGIEVLYVSPLRAFNVSRFTQVTRKRSVITITGVPRFVVEGLAIGVGLAAERPEIIVNVQAARSEGANLQARLLNLARIIEG